MISPFTNDTNARGSVSRLCTSAGVQALAAYALHSKALARGPMILKALHQRWYFFSHSLQSSYDVLFPE
jgi:hypothetical protein